MLGLEVGTIIPCTCSVNNFRLIVVENITGIQCHGCFFYNKECPGFECHGELRIDGKNIIYKEIAQ